MTANKAIVVYCCSKVTNRLRENKKSGLQTKTEGDTSNIKGKQQNNRNTKVQQQKKNKKKTTNQTTMQHTQKGTI